MGQSASSWRWRDSAAQRTSSTAGGVGLACALSVELSPITLPTTCVQLPIVGHNTPHQDPTEQPDAAGASAQLHAPPPATAQWLLPAPDSSVGSVPAVKHAETAADGAADADSGDAAPGVTVTNDAALRAAQLAATRRELDGARDKILRLLQQVVATQAARDRALEQANQQVSFPCAASRGGHAGIVRHDRKLLVPHYCWRRAMRLGTRYTPDVASVRATLSSARLMKALLKHDPREPHHRASSGPRCVCQG